MKIVSDYFFWLLKLDHLLLLSSLHILTGEARRLPAPEKVHVLTSAPDWKPQAVLWRMAAHRVLQSSDCMTFIQIQSDETRLQAHRVCFSHTSQSGWLAGAVSYKNLHCSPKKREPKKNTTKEKHKHFTDSDLFNNLEYNLAFLSTNLSCSRCCWDRQQTNAVRAVPARTARSSSRCWCKCCGCGRTCPSTWRTVTGSTWVWWQKRWWKLCLRLPWFCGFYSLPVENLQRRTWLLLFQIKAFFNSDQENAFSFPICEYLQIIIRIQWLTSQMVIRLRLTGPN